MTNVWPTSNVGIGWLGQIADSALPVIVALGKQQAIRESADGKTANFGRGDLQVPLEDPLKNRG